MMMRLSMKRLALAASLQAPASLFWPMVTGEHSPALKTATCHPNPLRRPAVHRDNHSGLHPKHPW